MHHFDGAWRKSRADERWRAHKLEEKTESRREIDGSVVVPRRPRITFLPFAHLSSPPNPLNHQARAPRTRSPHRERGGHLQEEKRERERTADSLVLAFFFFERLAFFSDDNRISIVPTLPPLEPPLKKRTSSFSFQDASPHGAGLSDPDDDR